MEFLGWRSMEKADLAGVMALARRVHPALPEDEAVFAERIDLYPLGCLVLSGAQSIDGYALAHPIRSYEPPALNATLGALPAEADEFYIHDFALAPERRGEGHATAGITRLLALAQGFDSCALISVYGTAGFWSRFGFMAVDGPGMDEKLRAYGPGAIYMRRESDAERA